MHELLEETEHRPWPVPDAPWIMEQKWRDLLFAHWPYAFDEVRALVPAELPLDMYDGKAWIGIVPFMLEDLRVRGLPAVPHVSSFPELNVRTYVSIDGKPGVYFFSLDAASKLAVMGARTLFHLNYFDADITISRARDRVVYSAHRTHPGAPPATFSASYTPVGEPLTSARGSLEYFLTERYCLYTVTDGCVSRLEIHHRPWLLQTAVADLDAEPLLRATGLSVPTTPPLLHFSSLQPMIGWAPEHVG